MTNDEREKIFGTKRGDISARRTKMTVTHLRGTPFFLGSSVASIIAAAMVAPGCGKPPCEETLTCPRTGNDGGKGGDDTAGSAGKSMAGAGGTATASGGMTATGGGGTAPNGGTAGGLAGKMDGAGEAGALPVEQCRTENDCTGSCRTCMDGACVAVKSDDDPDSCAGTCDADGICKSKRGQTCGLSGNGCVTGSVCADGYCCDAECGESCQACDVSGSEGTCTALKSGAPHGNRNACGGDGMCAGSCTGRSDGKCEYPTSDCGGGPTCSGTDFVEQSKCSNGDCVAPAAKTCDGGFACIGTACKASCGSDAECGSGYFCQSATCHRDAVEVAVGGNVSAAVLSDGSVYVWGENSASQLGPQGPEIGPSGAVQNVPIELTGLPVAAKHLAIGTFHVCAVLTNGEVWCWGHNASGSLGNGTLANNTIATPAKVTGLPSGVVAIGGEASTTCALVGSSGDVYCWGSNYSGLLGTNAAGDSPTPIRVAGVSNATQIAVAEHSCVVVGSALNCWGDNGASECGQPNTTYKITTPVELNIGLTPQQVVGAQDHSCVLLAGGTVRCWGQNSNGQLGDPDVASLAVVAEPVYVTGLTGVAQISSGGSTNCALLTGGKVRCWGWAGFGALGNGALEADINSYSASPVEVGGIANATSISTGAHSCAVLFNGSIKCWGEGHVGQLGNSLSSHSGVAVDVTATW